MSIEEIKQRILDHKDFFGGDFIFVQELEEATTKEEIGRVLDRQRNHLEDMLSDALSSHDSFKQSLKLPY